MLSEDIHDYYYVSQGKTTIPGMDDGEEFQLTDVRAYKSVLSSLHFLKLYYSLFLKKVLLIFVEMLGVLATVDDVV
jgi:hypothetical protein